MNFTDFLNEAKTKELYDFEKIKSELITAALPLHQYLKSYKEKYRPLVKDGVVLSEYKKAFYIELYAALKDQGERKMAKVYGKDSVHAKYTTRTNVDFGEDAELKNLLNNCMKEVKKVFKKYGLTQDKEEMKPASAARLVKSGEDLDVQFYIGWVKPQFL